MITVSLHCCRVKADLGRLSVRNGGRIISNDKIMKGELQADDGVKVFFSSVACLVSD